MKNKKIVIISKIVLFILSAVCIIVGIVLQNKIPNPQVVDDMCVVRDVTPSILIAFGICLFAFALFLKNKNNKGDYGK